MKRELRTNLKNKISTRVKAARRRREYRFYRIFLEISRIFKETKWTTSFENSMIWHEKEGVGLTFLYLRVFVHVSSD